MRPAVLAAVLLLAVSAAACSDRPPDHPDRLFSPAAELAGDADLWEPYRGMWLDFVAAPGQRWANKHELWDGFVPPLLEATARSHTVVDRSFSVWPGYEEGAHAVETWSHHPQADEGFGNLVAAFVGVDADDRLQVAVWLARIVPDDPSAATPTGQLAGVTPQPCLIDADEPWDQATEQIYACYETHQAALNP